MHQHIRDLTKKLARSIFCPLLTSKTYKAISFRRLRPRLWPWPVPSDSVPHPRNLLIDNHYKLRLRSFDTESRLFHTFVIYATVLFKREQLYLTLCCWWMLENIHCESISIVTLRIKEYFTNHFECIWGQLVHSFISHHHHCLMSNTVGSI